VTRHALDGWIPGDGQKNRWLRRAAETAVILGVALVLAAAIPADSGQVRNAMGCVALFDLG
jgi:hypothetical protein